MNTIRIALILLVLPLITAATDHKFYVSITKIEYVQEKASLQIISKIFIDDIEDVLQQRYDPNVSLATPKETKKEFEFIKKYLSQKIQIKVNGKPVEFTFIGKEYDTDIMKVYLEIENISSLKSLEISNEILMELFEEQQNIIHFKSNDTRRSLILDKDNPKGMLNFN